MSKNSLLFNGAPRWRQRPSTLQKQLPASLQSWLNETGSLTRRLRGIYGKRFGVEVLFHHWQPAFIDECRLLDLHPARYQLIREVLLHVDHQPLVLARTILPLPTIKIAHRNLSHLGSRPLGEVIFAYPDLERRVRQYSCAESCLWSPDLLNRVSLPQSVWGRRTVYAIHQQPLLVAEFFLPTLFL